VLWKDDVRLAKKFSSREEKKSNLGKNVNINVKVRAEDFQKTCA
jgi:hypothetical protein